MINKDGYNKLYEHINDILCGYADTRVRDKYI
jgi:hypothetical protein